MLAFDFQNVPADVAWVKSPGVRIHQAGQAGYHEQKLECHSQTFPFSEKPRCYFSNWLFQITDLLKTNYS